jgi:hypothetical protein
MAFFAKSDAASAGTSVPAPGDRPSWAARLPIWAMLLLAAAVVAAIGLAICLQTAWPIKALAWLDRVGEMLVGGTTLGKTALLVGKAAALAAAAGATAAFWAGRKRAAK